MTYDQLEGQFKYDDVRIILPAIIRMIASIIHSPAQLQLPFIGSFMFFWQNPFRVAGVLRTTGPVKPGHVSKGSWKVRYIRSSYFKSRCRHGGRQK